MNKKITLLSILCLFSLLSCGNMDASSHLTSSYSPNEDVSSSEEKKEVRIKLDGKGGYLENEEIILTYGSSYFLPVPEATGDMGNVVFQGWYYQGKQIETTGDSFPFDKDVTLTARWENIDFEFRLNGDDTYTLVSRKRSQKNVIVPSIYNGLKVTRISKGAFQYDMTMETLSLPSTMEYIQEDAFLGCGRLASVSFPSSMKKIFYSAFEGCSRLKKVYCSGNLEEYLSIDFEDKANPCSNGASLYFDNQPIDEIKIPTSITMIKSFAFDGVNNLKRVVLHDDVISIEEEAFHCCTKLTQINFPDKLKALGDYAFDGCYSLKEVSLGDEITVIPSGCFRKCYDLASLKLPSELTSIADSAFEGCQSLTDLVLPDKVEEISTKSFYQCSSLTKVSLSDCLVSIGESAFSYDTKIRSISFGKNITDIPSSSFSTCCSLEEISVSAENEVYEAKGNCLINKERKEVILGCMNSVLEEGILSIGKEAFFGCRKLKEISFPSSLTNISDYAFSNCDSLPSLSIGGNISYIGRNAFTGCDGITSISVSGENMNYANEDNCLLSKDKKNLIYGCSTSTIPDDVVTIDDEAFYFSSIRSITIPSHVKSIGKRAFANCYSLTDVNFEEGVTSLGEYSFSNLMTLEKITLPGSLEALPEGCFSKCYFLKEVTLNEGIVSIGDSCFYIDSDLTKIVLPSTLATIGDSAFGFDDGLALVDIEEGNTSFVFEDDLLMDSEKKRIYFGYGEVSIPSTIEEILPYALSGNDMTRELSLPEGLVYIGEKAFCNMRNLKKVSLPKSLTTINDEAFDGDENLSQVTYSSSMSDFAKMEIGYGIFSSTLVDDVCCSDGMVRLTEKYYC